MCGIAGIISKQPNGAINRMLASMSVFLRHRGPDDEGFLVADQTKSVTPLFGSDTSSHSIESKFTFSPKENLLQNNKPSTLGFLHRRLSILDLSPAGHQPMESDSCWITFNGEIYNYIEIKNELVALGHHFITNTDTEVILKGYLQWGFDCVKRFNGMWAFALYDPARNIVFCSRDRFGVKPFYYYADQENFLFASEQKALVQLPEVSTGISDKRVFEFFAYNQIEYAEDGMFKNILELFPSHNLIYDLNSHQYKLHQYYQLDIKKSPVDQNEASEQLRKLIFDSISLRLRSDVPVGSCLSGGIDSSAIVSIMANLSPEKKVELFTASFPEEQIDETHFAEKVASRFNANWNKVTPTSAELVTDIHDLIYCQDVPIWSSSTYAQFRVMKLAKERGVKVVLDGQGGDELFAGYPEYHNYYVNDLFRGGRWIRGLKELSNIPVPSPFEYYLKFLAKRGLNKTSKAYVERLSPEIRFLNKEFFDTYLNSCDPVKDPIRLEEKLKEEFTSSRLKLYLKCEDRCAMWHSVESRTPFSDDLPLIEFSFSLPSSLLIRGGINKYILRKALKGIVPEAVLQRKDKMGYVTPNKKWMIEGASELLDNFTQKDSRYLNVQQIKKEWVSILKNSSSAEGTRIFKLLSFAIWNKKFF